MQSPVEFMTCKIGTGLSIKHKPIRWLGGAWLASTAMPMHQHQTRTEALISHSRAVRMSENT
jgi:hypothetical protein